MNSIGLMRNYPNPFSNLTTVSFTMPTSGQATLVAVNMQGTEIARTDIGYIGEGTQRASFELHEHGMYFLRLFVDGRPVGNPIKVVSE
ncbi:MAG: T9SS type A sorting domain-containing protein [Bacteroidetes bacterium]|nr:T9SS type A sorting domain-containing protein [Bacteroidota bacterium]